MMKPFVFMTLLSVVACSTDKHEHASALHFGEVDGTTVHLYRLINDAGDTVCITNYGATITRWSTRDKNGNHSSVMLGFDSLQRYLQQPPYFGSTIGRYGNRIAGGCFTLDGIEYTLAKNNGVNHLHGGVKGFDKLVWTVDSVSRDAIVLSYMSEHMEEGYPGNLLVKVGFTLTGGNALHITYHATTDKPTVVNLTNHSYFNLSGDPSTTILDHQLQVNAEHYTPVDSTLIPKGTIAPVTNTPFDFTAPIAIGARIGQVPGGYDHNFVLRDGINKLKTVALLSDNKSGRTLEVLTTEPGLQFYSGNFLDGTFLNKHTGLCLETQHFPNSPNESAFPSTVLRPGETYHSETIYKISVK
jgi:aldose 1-epimerase